jgi:DNA-binding NarL/FixJ family response regulator
MWGDMNAHYASPESANGHQRVIKVLMVEDCAGDVHLLRAMLENAESSFRYDITSTPRLIDAFHCIERDTYDLVLLDLNLPDMDGIACVAAIHSQIPNTPIIVYSGMDDPKLRDEALRCGAAHYLVKGRESGYSMSFMIKNTLGH